MKNVKKYAVLLGILTTFFLNAVDVRNLFVIAHEIEELLAPDDVLYYDFFLALVEQSFPILVSKNMWTDFCLRRKIFKRKLDSSDLVARWLIDSAYDELQNELVRSFNEYGSFVSSEEMKAFLLSALRKKWNEIADEKKSEIKKLMLSAPAWITDLEVLKKYYILLEASFDAYLVPFSADDWTVYSYKDSWFLLIPQQYKNFVTQKANDNELSQDQHLGFTLDNLKKIDIQDSYTIDVPGSSSSVSLADALSNIIVSYDDLSSDVYPYAWNIIVTGHGMLNVKSADIRYLNQIIDEIGDILADIYEKIGYVSLEKVEEVMDAYIKKEKEEKRFERSQTLKGQLRVVRQMQSKLKEIMDSMHITIAGMSLENFHRFLLFLKNSVKMHTLLYTTCYTGSYNKLLPYLSWATFDRQERFPFTIISSGMADTQWSSLNKGIKFFNFISSQTKDVFPLYTVGADNVLFDANNIPYLVPMVSDMKTKKTFDLLSYEKTTMGRVVNTFFGQFVKSNISGEKKEINIAAVRYPNAIEFSSLPIGRYNVGKSYKITKTILHTKVVKGILSVPPVHDLIFDTYYMPVALSFKGPLPFCATSRIKITSKTMDALTLYIETVRTDHEPNIDDILSLLGTRKNEKDGAPKVILVDTWTVKDSLVMENVILFKKASFESPDVLYGYIGLYNDGIVRRRRYMHDNKIITDEIESNGVKNYLFRYDIALKEVTQSAEEDGLFPVSTEETKKIVE